MDCASSPMSYGWLVGLQTGLKRVVSVCSIVWICTVMHSEGGGKTGRARGGEVRGWAWA